MKELLLAKEKDEQIKTINVKEFEFKVKTSLTGMQLFQVEKLISEQIKTFPPIQDDSEVIYLPDEVKYIVCLLHHIVVEPKLTIEEWGLVFQRKPHIFLVLARKIAETFFGDNNLSSFFSEDMLSEE